MDRNVESTPVIRRETKNRISVDYEGKMTFKQRLLERLKASNTWITAVVNIFRFILMLGVSFVILHPFIARIAASFMTRADVMDNTIAFIPKNPTLEIYQALLFENRYFEAFGNTFLLSISCAIIQTIVSCLVGYGIAKFKFRGNKIVMAFVVITMVIPHNALFTSMTKHFIDFDLGVVISAGYPGIVEIINNVVSSIQGVEPKQVDLMFTFAPMIILSVGGLAFKNGLYIYMMRQFFKGIPDELEESAYVDGSGVFRTFVQIILPLSVPMMITIFLFSFSWQWTDEFYYKMFFMTNQAKYKVWLMPDIYQTMPTSLATDAALSSAYTNVIQNTAGMLIIAPLIVLYLFCQRYLVEGIERSGIVG